MKKLKVVVVMPAYNAAKTIAKSIGDIPKNVVDEVIVVDDASTDDTINVARNLGLRVITHQKNQGYGANQKTCYREALKSTAEVVVMIHPDYQYDASLTGELIRPILQGRFDIMFGGRIRTRREAQEGGMPISRYIVNRIISLIENIVLGVNFTEHLSGFRAYSGKVLNTLPIDKFSNDFVFDQQLMISAIAYGFKVAEYPIPVRYFSLSSSIQFWPGVKFLLQTFIALFQYCLYKLGIYKSKIFV